MQMAQARRYRASPPQLANLRLGRTEHPLAEVSDQLGRRYSHQQ
jgi:hypothetical protein